MKRLRELFSGRTARILLVAGGALALLIVSWLVFGEKQAQSTSSYARTEREERLAAVLSGVEDAGCVTVYITEEEGAPVGAVVMFDGEDGILVRLRLTMIAAQALGIAEQRVLVCPSVTQK